MRDKRTRRRKASAKRAARFATKTLRVGREIATRARQNARRMFEAFDSAVDARAVRRMAASTTFSVAAYGLIAALLLTVGARAVAPVLDKTPEVTVAFRSLPPPAPPAPVAKVVKPRPAAPAPLVAPTQVPKEAAPEAATEQVAAIAMAVGGTGDGRSASGEGSAVAPAPIHLPEDAQPPRELAENAQPEFPESARARGQEGLVILKIVVNEDGGVGAIQVLKGDEPFVGAALKAVKGWRYAPALVEGRPTAVYRIVKIPFRLKA